MATLSTLQAWLSEAEAARHALRLGRQTQSIQHGDRRIQYTQANAADLDAYIDDLERQIAEAQGNKGKRRIYRMMQIGTGY